MVSLPSANPFEQTFQSLNTTNMFQHTQNKEVASLTKSSFDKTITDGSMSSFLTSTKIIDEQTTNTTNKEPTIENGTTSTIKNTNTKLSYAEEIDMKKEEILKILKDDSIDETKQIFETTGNSRNRQLPKILYEKLNGPNKDYFSTGTWSRLGIECLYVVKLLHDKGILHRDIKPSNFALGPADDCLKKRLVYLFDFGLARRLMNTESIKKELRSLAEKAQTGKNGQIEGEFEKNTSEEK